MKRQAKTASILRREKEIGDFLSTGSTLLDLAISCMSSKQGGIPTNRITEFSGGGASGKTYICGELCGDALREGYEVVVDDIERRWVLSRMDTFDFYPDTIGFTYLDPPSSSVEACFETMFKHMDKLKADKKMLYIVDPIAALYSKIELTPKSDKMGQARAKALQKNMRHLKDRVTSLGKPDITVVFSNQLIDAVGAKFKTKVSPGGNAMRHWPSLRIRFLAPGRIIRKKKIHGKEVQKTVGIKLHAQVRKNSVDDAYREADISIVYSYGIDDIADCVNWLDIHTSELLSEKGEKWYCIFDKDIYTKARLIKHVEDNDLEEELQQLVIQQFRKYYKPEQRKPKKRI